jgi:chemotaxis protein MotB
MEEKNLIKKNQKIKVLKSNHDRWLISYADLITLLFSLFVLLYATAKTDSEKFKKIAKSLAQAFGNVDLSVQMHSKGDSRYESQSPVKVEVKLDENLNSKNDFTLKELASLIEQNLRIDFPKQNFSKDFFIQFEEKKVILKISTDLLFEKQSAEIKKEGLKFLDPIFKALKENKKFKIRIEAHTDNLKLNSELYPSHWELSSAQAGWIARILIEQYNVSPNFIEIAGLADTRPIVSFQNPNSEKENNRIEIIILDI